MEQRKAHRVVFERGFAANMMAIDGTWQRPCTMQDVSETGARLSVGGSIEGLPLKEFFLVLSTVGKAYRRCQLAWVNGDQVGVRFIKAADIKKKSQQPVARVRAPEAVGPDIVDGPHRLKMAGFEQEDRSSAEFERQRAPCQILRLIQPRDIGQAYP